MPFWSKNKKETPVNLASLPLTVKGALLKREVGLLCFNAANDSAGVMAKQLLPNSTISRTTFLQLTKMTLEFHSFYLHMVDRFAFELLGQSKRDLIIDSTILSSLENAIATCFPEADDLLKQRMVAEALTNFNNAQEEYAGCKVLLAPAHTMYSDIELPFPTALTSRLYRNVMSCFQDEYHSDPESFMALLVVMTEQVIPIRGRVVEIGQLLS